MSSACSRRPTEACSARSRARSASAALTSSAAASSWPSTAIRISLVSDWSPTGRSGASTSGGRARRTPSRRRPPLRVRVLDGAGAEVCEVLVPGGEAHRDRADDPGLVEHGHGQPIADTHEVAGIDEQADARDVPVLRQPPQQRLGGVPVAGRLDAEVGEDPAPRDDARQRARGLPAEPLERAFLLGLVGGCERGQRVHWSHPGRAEDLQRSWGSAQGPGRSRKRHVSAAATLVYTRAAATRLATGTFSSGVCMRSIRPAEGDGRDAEPVVDASLEDARAAGDARRLAGHRGCAAAPARSRSPGRHRALASCSDLPAQVDAVLAGRFEQLEQLLLRLGVGLVGVRPAVDCKAELRRDDVEVRPATRESADQHDRLAGTRIRRREGKRAPAFPKVFLEGAQGAHEADGRPESVHLLVVEPDGQLTDGYAQREGAAAPVPDRAPGRLCDDCAGRGRIQASRVPPTARRPAGRPSPRPER